MERLPGERPPDGWLAVCSARLQAGIPFIPHAALKGRRYKNQVESCLPQPPRPARTPFLQRNRMAARAGCQSRPIRVSKLVRNVPSEIVWLLFLGWGFLGFRS